MPPFALACAEKLPPCRRWTTQQLGQPRWLVVDESSGSLRCVCCGTTTTQRHGPDAKLCRRPLSVYLRGKTPAERTTLRSGISSLAGRSLRYSLRIISIGSVQLQSNRMDIKCRFSLIPAIQVKEIQFDISTIGGIIRKLKLVDRFPP